MPSPASVAKVATISRSLRQETANPNSVNTSRRAPAVQVEMAWKRVGGFEEQRGEYQHARQAVHRGFQAVRGSGARRRDQPQHGVDQPDGDTHSGREGARLGECAEQVSACQAEQSLVRERAGPTWERVQERRWLRQLDRGRGWHGEPPADNPIANSMRATRV